MPPLPPSAAPRVLVVEDNDFTRMTLSGALVNAGLDVVGETGSAAKALRIARRRAPDAAMLDLSLAVEQGGGQCARITVIDDGSGPVDGRHGMGSSLLDETAPGAWSLDRGTDGGAVLTATVPLGDA